MCSSCIFKYIEICQDSNPNSKHKNVDYYKDAFKNFEESEIQGILQARKSLLSEILMSS